jgi:hypothetical protein
VNGTKTFDVINGGKGADGEDGEDGTDGIDATGVKVAMGAYTGAGATSKTLTFDFNPKMVVVQGKAASCVALTTYVHYSYEGNNTVLTAVGNVYWSEKSLEISIPSFDKQGVFYKYVAIG